MGRMLEALRQAGTGETQAEAPPAEVRPLQVVSAESPDEDMPYIEVGAKGRAVEGSPDVLAAPAVRMAPARTPALAPPGPLSVAFQPCRVAATPAPRLAAEVIAYHQPDHEVSKQYRALLGQVLPAAADEDGHVLLFTALGRGAGVTTALLNLAVSACAAEGREVVVVEANLTRPALAARVGLPPGPGLRDLVAGSASLDQAVRPTVQERLHVLTAGSAASEAGGLSAEAVRWVTSWLKQRFGLIFLDGPACDAGAELAALVGSTDRVLLVLDRADTESPEVRAATRAIARMGGHLGGLLVTGC